MNPVDLKELVKINSKPGGRFEIGKRIKFSIKKDELNGLIKELDKASVMLTQLRKAFIWIEYWVLPFYALLINACTYSQR